MRAFPARTPVPGENKPWESKTGRVRTQPQRGSRAGSSARGPSAPRSTRSTRFRRRSSANSAPPQHQHSGGTREHGVPSSRDAGSSNPLGAASGPSTRGDSVDPRLLQSNLDSSQTRAAPEYSPFQPPSAIEHDLLPWSSVSTRPPAPAERDLLPGPAPGPAEVMDADLDETLWEFVRFDCDEEGAEEAAM